MRKYLLGALALLLLASCGSSTFTVKGTLKNVDDSNLYVLKVDTANFKICDTITLAKDGSFEYTGEATELSYFRLLNRMYNFNVLVKGGDEVELHGDAGTPYVPYTITGGQDSEQLMDLQKMYIAYKVHLQDLNTEYQQAITQKGLNMDSVINALDSTERIFAAELVQKAKDFVNANEQSLSSLIAFNYIDPSKDMGFINDYLKKLQASDLAANPYAALFIRQVSAMNKLSESTQAPEIALPTPEGKTLKLSSMRGNYVLVDFWASWCKPCRAENPNVVKAYAAFKDKGLKILGVSLDTDKSKWLEAIKTDQLSWEQVSDLSDWDSSKAAADYKVESIPSNFLLDKEGNIIARDLRGEELFSTLNKLFSAN